MGNTITNLNKIESDIGAFLQPIFAAHVGDSKVAFMDMVQAEFAKRQVELEHVVMDAKKEFEAGREADQSIRSSTQSLYDQVKEDVKVLNIRMSNVENM